MIATFERYTKFEKACMEAIKRAEEREKVEPITYKCLKCKDKKWIIWWEDGYEYADPCICQTWDEDIPI